MMMQESTKISERRACQLVGLSGTVLHYEPKAQPANEQLQVRLIELAGERRLHALIRRKGIALTDIARQYLSNPT